MVKSRKRFPFLMWGDLVEGGRPVLRRALAGYRAHECMYAWVYLTEYLAHLRLRDLLPGLPHEMRPALFERMDGPLWRELDRSVVDPHYQLTASMFELVAAMTLLAADSGERQPTFVELGSTFFTSKIRFDIVNRVASERFADWPRLEPRWFGIDNSAFMHDSTRALHGREGIELVTDYRSLNAREGFTVLLSRFVASYAFTRGSEFVHYLDERFDAAVIEDAYSTSPAELAVFNHGQPERFFSIPEVFGGLESRGFEVYLLDSYPDHPADAAPCHVIRYLATRKGLVGDTFKPRLRDLGFSSLDRPEIGLALLDRLNRSVTPARWRAVRKAKRESPVWGKTPEALDTGLGDAVLRRAKDWVRRYVLYPGWRRYRLGGPLAEREIVRAMREEKP